MRIVYLLALALFFGVNCGPVSSSSTGGSGSSSGGGSGGGSGGSSGGSTGSDSQSLDGESDDFESGELDDSWSFFSDTEPGSGSYGFDNGRFYIEIEVSNTNGWGNGENSVFLFKTITGNFRASATVRARRLPPNDDDPVIASQNLAGIMVRDPDADLVSINESSVSIEVGNPSGSDGSQGIQTQSTVDGTGTYAAGLGTTRSAITSWADGDAEVRICRINTTYYMYRREVGGTTWTHEETYERIDDLGPPIANTFLPSNQELNEMQVGLIAYGVNGPDLRAEFDEIIFQRIYDEPDDLDNPAECQQEDN